MNHTFLFKFKPLEAVELVNDFTLQNLDITLRYFDANTLRL